MTWRRRASLIVVLAHGLLAGPLPFPSSRPAAEALEAEAQDVAELLTNIMFTASCRTFGGIDETEARRRIDQERMKYPKDLPILLYFWVDAIEDQNTGSRCIVRFDPAGGQVGSGGSAVFAPPSSGSIMPHKTTGLNPAGLSGARNAKLRLERVDPAGSRVPICHYVVFRVQATFEVDGQQHSLPAAALPGLSWASSDDAALAPLTGAQDPGTFGIPGGVAVKTFQARREGQYAVTVSLERIAPGDLTAAALAGNPALAGQLAQALTRANDTAGVAIAGPTVKEIVVPSPGELEAGQAWDFTAQVLFQEGCVPPVSLPNRFVVPKPPPSTLAVVPVSHRSLEAQACDIAQFEARLLYEARKEQITVAYGGTKGGSTVTVRPPPSEDVTNAVVWATPTGSPVFEVRGTDPIHVKATHGATGLTDGRTLQVKAPTLRGSLDVLPDKGMVEAGEEVAFRARASYAQTCLPSMDVTDLAQWTPGPPRAVATEPGRPITRKATYVAQNGDQASGEASVAVAWPPLVLSPPEAVLTLGQEQGFSAFLANARFSRDVSAEVTWPNGRAFKADRCGLAEISAIHQPSGKTQNAPIEVTVNAPECLAIRQALTSMRPDHEGESRQWIARRDALLAKGCTCDVPEVPWTSGESETEQVPDGDRGGGQDLPPIQVSVGVAPPMSPSGSGGPGEGCSDPRREPMKTPDGKMACGACRAGFFPNGPDRCATPGEVVDAVSCSDSRMTKTYDARTGQVICCPPASPVWNPVQGQCALSPEQATGPRPVGSAPEGMGPAIDIGGIFFPPIFGPMPRSQPPGPSLAPAPAPRTVAPSAPAAPSRCHRNPQTGQLHCSSN